MLGLIKVKYKNFPTSLLYMLRSLEPSVLLNFVNCSIGVCAGLLAKNMHQREPLEYTSFDTKLFILYFLQPRDLGNILEFQGL